ncbi:MAG: hypothetical protein Q4E86_11145 [Lachnospiraceae bacterium]|nr:hypothetical protein [Lachnospiraceae bacterium]
MFWKRCFLTVMFVIFSMFDALGAEYSLDVSLGTDGKNVELSVYQVGEKRNGAWELTEKYQEAGIDLNQLDNAEKSQEAAEELTVWTKEKGLFCVAKGRTNNKGNVRFSCGEGAYLVCQTAGLGTASPVICFLPSADGSLSLHASLKYEKEEEPEKPTKPDPTKPEPSEEEPTKPDPTEPEPSEEEPTKPEPSKEEPTKPDPTKPEPSGDGPNEPDGPEPSGGQPDHPDEPTNPEPSGGGPDIPERTSGPDIPNGGGPGEKPNAMLSDGLLPGIAGQISAALADLKIPRMGDTSNLSLLFGIMLVSLGGILLLIYVRIRSRQNQDSDSSKGQYKREGGERKRSRRRPGPR